MTRDEILAMKPGRELDALVAEHVFEWRKIHGPKTDYNGPCESFDVLIPPTIEDPFPLYPSTGVIKPWWFCREWSTDLLTVWEVLDYLYSHKCMHYEVKSSRYYPELGYIAVIWTKKGRITATGDDVPEVICKAALLTKLEVNHESQSSNSPKTN